MLTIVHGDDIVASRKYFTDLKEKHAGAHFFDGASVTLTDLAQIFDGGGLFEDSKAVFIEQFFVKKLRGNAKSKSSEADALLAYLEKHSSIHAIFLWENKEIDRGSLLAFKSADVKAFKLPQTLFLLLDSIKPDNGKKLVQIFHQTIENAEPEMIFFMLIRQIRLLLALNPSQPPLVRGGASSPLVKGELVGVIDEIKRMQPWQRSKLEKQAALFSTEKLKDIYQKLFKIEVGQKTGSIPLTLTSEIDFLLLEI